jgi:5-methylcytosine-specific restriction endonuclease McrA
MRRSFRPSSSKGYSKPKKKPEYNKEWYGDDWPELSAYVKKRDSYSCMAFKIGGPKCGGRFPPPFSKLLHAHHIVPLPKGTNHPTNLITVCNQCHGSLHGKYLGNISYKQRMAASRIL